MVEPKTADILIFGKINNIVKELEIIFIENSFTVSLVSDLASIVEFLPNNRFKLIVVTDAFKGRMDRNLFEELKRCFPDAKIIYLFETVTRAVEISARKAGVIFLGSYDYFNQFSADILQSAVKVE